MAPTKNLNSHRATVRVNRRLLHSQKSFGRSFRGGSVFPASWERIRETGPNYKASQEAEPATRALCPSSVRLPFSFPRPPLRGFLRPALTPPVVSLPLPLPLPASRCSFGSASASHRQALRAPRFIYNYIYAHATLAQPLGANYCVYASGMRRGARDALAFPTRPLEELAEEARERIIPTNFRVLGSSALRSHLP